MTPQCDHCQTPLPPEANACPTCGKAVSPKPPLRWQRKPPADAAVTQYIEIPPGGFPAPLHPVNPPVTQAPEKTDRSSLLVAVTLGLLTGLLVILVIFGIATLRRVPKTPTGAASTTPASPTPGR